MFRRRWIWFGELVSDEGFTLRYGHRSITYSDERGSFQFGFEDGLLFSNAHQIAGTPTHLDRNDLEQKLQRVVSGIRFEGHPVEIDRKRDQDSLHPKRSLPN
jgi:hypothetical protein